MPEYDYESLLNATLNQKPIEFNDTFHDIMIDKLHHVINNKKIEIAQNMFRTVKEPEDISVEDSTEE